MKRFRSNAKIEYRTLPLSIPSENRYLEFRICPSELNLWQRLFQNGWRNVYTAYETYETFGKLSFIFSYREAIEITNKYRTWGEITEFLNNEYNIIKKINNQKNLERYNKERLWDNVK